MKINEMISICTKLQKSLEMPMYEYHTSGVPTLGIKCCEIGQAANMKFSGLAHEHRKNSRWRRLAVNCKMCLGEFLIL
jgi:hypothetical protein